MDKIKQFIKKTIMVVINWFNPIPKDKEDKDTYIKSISAIITQVIFNIIMTMMVQQAKALLLPVYVFTIVTLAINIITLNYLYKLYKKQYEFKSYKYITSIAGLIILIFSIYFVKINF